MPPVHSHDSLFHTLIQDPVRADALIRQCTPPETAALLSDEPFSPLAGTFVNEALRVSRADGVFTTSLKDGGVAYSVLEHKSNVDAGTPLQIGNYVIGILRNHERLKGRDNPRVPPLVIPIVVYHGRARWSVPRSARGLAHRAGDPFRYHLLDLGRIPYAELSSDASLRGGLGLLKYAMVENPPEGDLVEALRALRSLKELPVEYMMTNYELPRETLERLVRNADPELWEKVMPTVAEVWKKEGRDEGLMQGLTQGLTQGKAETLLRLLERRFDTVPEDARARVLAAPAEDLDAWLDTIFSASSLDDVFGNESIH